MIQIKKTTKFAGTLSVPGDKSLSHRALIFGAIAEGTSRFIGLSEGEDLQSTRRCLEALGVKIQQVGDETVVEGVGLYGLKEPQEPLDCGNSGTTVRLLLGLLSGQPFSTTLIGDASLSRRPMGRVTTPLRKMGATIKAIEGDLLPITIKGGDLSPIDYDLPIASAQVKTALLIAALYAKGTTKLTGKIESRDHTERLLAHLGVNLEITEQAISLHGPQPLLATSYTIPGDPSSAAFWAAGAALLPGSEVHMTNILLNPTRIAFFEVLREMGALITIKSGSQGAPEPIGDIIVRSGNLKGITLDAERIPFLIDEIPLIAILGAFADGTTLIRGAQELRIKESDRLEATCQNLKMMGAKVEMFSDGLLIKGPQSLHGASLDTFGDHRIAMAFSIASLRAQGVTTLNHEEVVSISYPQFFQSLEMLSD